MSDEQLVVLGSGCGIPNPKRGSQSLLLESQNRNVLIDAGPGTQQRMAKAGVYPQEIDLILLTHFHLDHVAELPFLLFSLRIDYGDRREKPLAIVGSEGLSDHYRKLKACYGRYVLPHEYELAIVEAGQGKHRIAGFELEAIPVEHTEESVGYRIKTPGGRVVSISGDTDVCPQLVDLGKDADILVLECSFPEGSKFKGHLVPSEAGQIAAESGCKRLLLVHFYPLCDQEDMALQASKTFPGEVIAGKDMLTIDL